MPPIPLLLSAGEASGDMYAARLATALKQRLDVAIFGMGGPQMRAAGGGVLTGVWERAGPPGAAACDSDGLPRFSSAPGAQAATQGHSKRLLHLPAILGVAAVAREFSAAAVRTGAVYFPFRRNVLRRCRRAGEIHRPSARGKRESHADAGIFLQKIRSGRTEQNTDDSARKPAGGNRAPCTGADGSSSGNPPKAARTP